MPRATRLPVLTAVVALISPTFAAGPATGPATTRPAGHASARAVVTTHTKCRQLGVACNMYMSQHRGMFPADLGQTLPYLTKASAEVFVTPDDAATLAPLPDPVTAAWVTAHSSWVYLGKDVKASKVRRPWETVLLHTKLDAPLTDPKAGPVVIVGYADGHVVAVPAEQAKAQVEASTKALDDARAAAKP